MKVPKCRKIWDKRFFSDFWFISNIYSFHSIICESKQNDGSLETDLDHLLDTKNIEDPDFPIYFLQALVEVCTLWVNLFISSSYFSPNFFTKYWCIKYWCIIIYDHKILLTFRFAIYHYQPLTPTLIWSCYFLCTL